MQKNWHMVYIKPNAERRASALLKKKKVENFCPLNCRQVKHLRKNKLLYEPLFGSYLFVNVKESDLSALKKFKYIVNVVYWRDKPAVIHNEEIEAIKEFTHFHRDIKLEKSPVNINDVIRTIDKPSYSVAGNLVSVKNNSISVNLPSLGFIMTSEIERESMFGEEATVLQNNSLRRQKNIR